MTTLRDAPFLACALITLLTGAARAETLPVPFEGTTLAATLSRPAGAQPATVVLITPGSERMPRSFYAGIAERFVREGLAALTFDRAGEGESGGVWDSTQSHEPIARAGLAVLRAALERPDVEPRVALLWGISQGGWTGMTVAAREPRVKLVMLVSDPALPEREELLNERWWRLLDQGYSREEADEITAMRRVLWRYYGTGERPAGFSELWNETIEKPWFARIGWPRWEPTPDSIASAQRAVYASGWEPSGDPRASLAPILRVYGADDRHIRVDRSLAAARAAYRGLDRDTTFLVYPGRGHGLQSTAGAPEHPGRPGHEPPALALDDDVWRDFTRWLRPRLERLRRGR